jgi:hypothetical protein
MLIQCGNRGSVRNDCLAKAVYATSKESGNSPAVLFDWRSPGKAIYSPKVCILAKMSDGNLALGASLRAVGVKVDTKSSV